MILNERETEEGTLVAVCDRDVLGETFENGDLSLTVTEEFYDGERVERAVVVERLADADVANLVGTRVVELAVEEGFVDQDRVLELDGTHHAQFMRL
ncbi:MAG: DUF424 domain-containing protein [Haloarculaceae archaeon]